MKPTVVEESLSTTTTRVLFQRKTTELLHSNHFYGIRDSNPGCTLWHSPQGTLAHPHIMLTRIIIYWNSITNNNLENTKIKGKTRTDYDWIIQTQVITTTLQQTLKSNKFLFHLALQSFKLALYKIWADYSHWLIAQWFLANDWVTPDAEAWDTESHTLGCL